VWPIPKLHLLTDNKVAYVKHALVQDEHYACSENILYADIFK